MAGKPPSIPSCSLHRSIFAISALIFFFFFFFFFSIFSFRSLRSPPQSQIHYSSNLPLSDALKPSFDGSHSVSSSSIYHSREFFSASYEEMERRFRVYIYPDGDPKTYYQTPRNLTGKYASEGYFFQNIRESRFHTEDPDLTHLFFIPISCHKMSSTTLHMHLDFAFSSHLCIFLVHPCKTLNSLKA